MKLNFEMFIDIISHNFSNVTLFQFHHDISNISKTQIAVWTAIVNKISILQIKAISTFYLHIFWIATIFTDEIFKKFISSPVKKQISKLEIKKIYIFEKRCEVSMALLRSDILNKDFIERVIRQCEVRINKW